MLPPLGAADNLGCIDKHVASGQMLETEVILGTARISDRMEPRRDTDGIERPSNELVHEAKPGCLCLPGFSRWQRQGIRDFEVMHQGRAARTAPHVGQWQEQWILAPKARWLKVAQA
jgi:hypothetical protein